MALRAIQNQSLPDQVFGQLATQIFKGAYKPGENLPAERQLAEIFGVNRHVVREATKRAEQIGLVSVTQGGGTKVLDFERTAGLDLLALMAEHTDVTDFNIRLWLGGLEMRAAIGVDLARLCALRGDQKVKDDLVAIANELRAAPEGPGLIAIDRRFWERMLDGAGNIAYRLAFNSLIKGADTRPELHLSWTIQELQQGDHRMPIARAIAEGDSAAAEAAASTALRGAIDALAIAIENGEIDAGEFNQSTQIEST
jgi:GntR family transcriptional repressor for pyruvate dehydrogenase complex